jgi:hypothetical protein
VLGWSVSHDVRLLRKRHLRQADGPVGVEALGAGQRVGDELSRYD